MIAELSRPYAAQALALTVAFMLLCGVLLVWALSWALGSVRRQKAYELLYRLLSPLDQPLAQRVRRTLLKLNPEHLLDVGGRRSNYTIGLNKVTISDIPRESAQQNDLDLGFTDPLRASVLKRRSNVTEYVCDDMVSTGFEAATFDVVNATEVLEHVTEDDRFVANVAKVLKSGGYFVMSTPNGDFIPVPYPDHKRHYKAAELGALLRRHFREVRVEYCVNSGVLSGIGYRWGVLGTWAYALSAALERLGFGGTGPANKGHLFAVCRK